MTELISEHMLGPSGGLFAMGFILGGMGAYAFASRTIISDAKNRILKLESKVEALQIELMKEIRK